MPVTAGDSIFSPDIGAAQNQPGYTATMASSVQAAFNKRQRYQYVWANDAARVSQLGMSEGAQGYQIDTKTEYQYENGSWRLAAPHAEFMASANLAPGAPVKLLGAFTLDTGNSTSTTFATPDTTAGAIKLVDPGIYATSTLTQIVAASSQVTGRTFLDLSTTADDSGLLVRSSINAGENYGSITMPNLRVTGSGQLLYYKAFHSAATTYEFRTRVRITRIA
jgi:hypothetical protein